MNYIKYILVAGCLYVSAWAMDRKSMVLRLGKENKTASQNITISKLDKDLRKAAQAGDLVAVTALLELGADAFIVVDKNDKSAFVLARDRYKLEGPHAQLYGIENYLETISVFNQFQYRHRGRVKTALTVTAQLPDALHKQVFDYCYFPSHSLRLPAHIKISYIERLLARSLHKEAKGDAATAHYADENVQSE